MTSNWHSCYLAAWWCVQSAGHCGHNCSSGPLTTPPIWRLIANYVSVPYHAIHNSSITTRMCLFMFSSSHHVPICVVHWMMSVPVTCSTAVTVHFVLELFKAHCSDLDFWSRPRNCKEGTRGLGKNIHIIWNFATLPHISTIGQATSEIRRRKKDLNDSGKTKWPAASYMAAITTRIDAVSVTARSLCEKSRRQSEASLHHAENIAFHVTNQTGSVLLFLGALTNWQSNYLVSGEWQCRNVRLTVTGASCHWC